MLQTAKSPIIVLTVEDKTVHCRPKSIGFTNNCESVRVQKTPCGQLAPDVFFLSQVTDVSSPVPRKFSHFFLFYSQNSSNLLIYIDKI